MFCSASRLCRDRTCMGTPDAYISKQYVKTGDQNATAMLCQDFRAAEQSIAIPVHVRISPKYIGYLAYLNRPSDINWPYTSSARSLAHAK